MDFNLLVANFAPFIPPVLSLGMWLWLARKFDNIDEKIEKIKDDFDRKLEYHERHDDSRFSQLSNNVWELRLQQAMQEGRNILDRKNNSEKTNEKIDANGREITKENTRRGKSGGVHSFGSPEAPAWKYSSRSNRLVDPKRSKE